VLVALVATLIATIVVIAVFAALTRPWLRGFLYGAPVPLIHILAMRLRGNPPMMLIDAYIALRRSGIETTIAEVENIYIDCRTRVRDAGDLADLVKSRQANVDPS
jgi:hypothetical protein